MFALFNGVSEKLRKTPGRQLSDHQFQVAESFKSPREIAWFLSVIVFFLAWPWINFYLLSSKPGDAYKSVPSLWNYNFFGESIAKGGDVDVLFVGASDVWTAVDSRLIAAELTKEFGRPVRVLNFGTGWAGTETYYARVVDALKTMKVKLVVFAHQASLAKFHPFEKYVWRPGEVEPPEGLSRHERAVLYAAGMLGAPVHAWSGIRGVDNVSFTRKGAIWTKNNRKTLGTYWRKRGFRGRKWPSSRERLPYTNPSHPLPTTTGAEMILNGDNADEFQVMKTWPPYSTFETAFYKATARLVHDQGGKFAMMSIPAYFTKSRIEKAEIRMLAGGEKTEWPQIGIPMTTLFEGLSFDETLAFYADERHLNPAGSRVFSGTIVRAIAELLKK
jgi:hypothetical protein